MIVIIALTGCPGRAFRDDFFGGDDGGALSRVPDVAGAAAAGGRGAAAFANDFAVDVDGAVGADVAGAWEGWLVKESGVMGERSWIPPRPVE